MSVAVEAEQVVAGYVNTHEDGAEFSIEDIYDYILSLWNAGCGPIRLNFTKQDMARFLDSCRGVCLNENSFGYTIDKSLLRFEITPEEKAFLQNDAKRAQSFALFCKLQVDLRTPNRLLDVMGFRFMYEEPKN